MGLRLGDGLGMYFSSVTAQGERLTCLYSSLWTDARQWWGKPSKIGYHHCAQSQVAMCEQ